MFGCRNALIAHSRDPRQIRLHPHRLAVGEFRSIQKARKRCNMRILPKPEKHPTSFLAPLGKPSLHKNADVSGNTRLALPHHLRYLPDSQFHRPEQVNNPEPRRVGQSPEDVEYGCTEWSI